MYIHEAKGYRVLAGNYRCSISMFTEQEIGYFFLQANCKPTKLAKLS